MSDRPQEKTTAPTVGRPGARDNSHGAKPEHGPHAPRKTPRQARSKHLVEAILEAAARVFDAQGFAKGNTNQIAALAGVSVGSLYQYFPNKKALITALHDRHVQEVGQAMSAVFDGAEQSGLADLVDLVERLVQALLQVHQRQARLQWVLHTELAYYRAPAAKAHGMAQPAQRLRALLHAQRPELGAAQLEQTVALALHLGEALVHAAVLNPPPGVSAAQLAAGVAQAILGLLRGPAG